MPSQSEFRVPRDVDDENEREIEYVDKWLSQLKIVNKKQHGFSKSVY